MRGNVLFSYLKYVKINSAMSSAMMDVLKPMK